jgi:integrase
MPIFMVCRIFQMPKIVTPLSDLQVRRITRVGWHAVGGVAGLLLQVRKPEKVGSQMPRSWILRIKVGDQRQPIGLGSYPQVSLAAAREQAAKLSIEAKQGVNLKAKKTAQRSALIAAAAKNKTFQECAAAYMDAHSSDHTNEKHRKQWPATLFTYAYPIIGKMLVSDIAMRDVRNVLEQETVVDKNIKGKLWYVKTETAKRLLGRIKTVLDYATVNDYRSGTNPAQWTGFLSTQLPSPKNLQKKEHHPAVPYQQIGDFMSKLRSNSSLSAKALEFLILTAVRSGSVRSAEWSEIDLDNALWIIPAEHTKARQEHRVPLQPQAIRLLKSLPKLAETNLIFPSRTGKALSDMAFSQLMRGMRERGELTVEAVPHGFRSTFRDWAAEQTAYPDEIRKAASGHTVGDSVKAAYQRTDLLEKRRRLMVEWAKFLDEKSIAKSDKVTKLMKVK